MQIIIKTHHVGITNALKEYARKKMDKLELFFDHIQTITVSLNIESSSSSEDSQVASAVVSTSGAVFTGKEVSSDMYSSIDLLLDKLVVQLKRYKEKLKNHRGKVPVSLNYEKSSPNGHRTSDITPPRYIPKPMGLEDAAEILKDESMSFLVFRNLKERICVIYPSENGEFGVIET